MIKGERAVVKVDDDEGWQGLLSMSETRLVGRFSSKLCALTIAEFDQLLFMYCSC